jgi:hypothetical protein
VCYLQTPYRQQIVCYLQTAYRQQIVCYIETAFRTVQTVRNAELKLCYILRISYIVLTALPANSLPYCYKCHIKKYSRSIGWFKICFNLENAEFMNIKINLQPDATIFQFIILTYIYSSTWFGRFPAHHQELNDRRSSLWFYLCIVVTAVLLVVVGPARPRPTALLPPRSNGKTRGCYCSC